MLLVATLLAGCGSFSAPKQIQVGSPHHAAESVGPGPVNETVHRNGFRIELSVTPNRAAAPNTFALRITKGGSAVSQAAVIVGFSMLDMEMGTQRYAMRETAPGRYERSAPVLVMGGHWRLSFKVKPLGQQSFTILFVDRTTA